MNKECRFLLAFLCCVLVWQCIAFSQVSQEWVARYNGSGNADDYAYSLAADVQGNVYVTGTVSGSGTGLDFVTIKYNSSGMEQWHQLFNGTGNGDDQSYSVAVDAIGSVYVTGMSYSTGTYYDIVTIKYSPSGIVQWVRNYNGPAGGNDGSYALALDASASVYIAGWSAGIGTGLDYTVLKYSTDGIQQWVQRYNGTANGDDIARSLALDASGFVYVTGQSVGSSTGQDYTTIKYSSSGVQQWIKGYNYVNAGNDFAWSIAVNKAGNAYVTGRFYVPTTQWNYATLKYDSAGTQQWAKVYYGPGNHYWSYEDAYSVAVDSSGNAYVTGGSTNSPGNFDFAYCTIKYSATGDQDWVQRYDGPGVFDDNAFSIAVDAAGNSYVTGESGAEGSGFDYATIKYGTGGDQQWVERYNGPANDSDIAYCVKTDGAGNVYVTGWSRGVGTGYDFATIKYSQLTGVNPVSSEIPKSFSLHQNYPNPFNPSTKIKFDIPEVGNAYMRSVQLLVYDALGREAAVLVNESLKPGSYEIEWNSANQPSGVYFYTLSAGDFMETKKMILLK